MVRFWLVLLAARMAIVFCEKRRVGGSQSYCEGDFFKATCAHDEVIVMEKALYGRMRLGRCVKVDMGYIGCTTNVLDLADRHCSGRRHCDIRIPDPTFEKTQPCLELKSYLEASYYCLKVLVVDANTCRDSKYLEVEDRRGHVASVTARETWCGTGDVPWRIRAKPGQHINVTLIDFSVSRQSNNHMTEDTYHPVEICQKYAVINEESPPGSTYVCGGRRRTRHVYLSKSNVIDIQVLNRRSNGGNFVLSYEVVGCPDPEISSKAWSRREGNIVVVGCSHTSDTWRLECIGDTWVGELSNCSHYANVTGTEARTGQTGLRRNVVIAAVCGIAVVVGASVMVLGILLLKRNRKRAAEEEQPPVSPKSTEESDVDDEEYLKPTSEGNYSERPNLSCPNYERGKRTCKNEYTHIWEMPLPETP